MDDRLVLALDGMGFLEALNLTKEVGCLAYAVKVHDLFDWRGPTLVADLKKAGAQRLWADLKFLDIAQTVEYRARALKAIGVDIVTVHAQGGRDMVRAAVASGLEVFAVTALTSLTPTQVHDTFGRTPAEAVAFFAEMAASAGAAGFICSPLEVSSLAHIDSKFQRVVPGTRSVGVGAGDQKRVATPFDTLRAGATRLVIGSQVTKDPDPVGAWLRLVEEIAEA